MFFNSSIPVFCVSACINSSRQMSKDKRQRTSTGYELYGIDIKAEPLPSAPNYVFHNMPCAAACQHQFSHSCINQHFEHKKHEKCSDSDHSCTADNRTNIINNLRIIRISEDSLQSKEQTGKDKKQVMTVPTFMQTPFLR